MKTVALAVCALLFAARVVSAQPRPIGQVISGVAIDATGAVLPDATVVLTTAANVTVQTTTTDGAGAFRFGNVPQGRYEVQIRLEGFQLTTAKVNVGTAAPSPLVIKLPLAAGHQEITVTALAAEVSARASANSDAVKLDQSLLESLPVLDQDLIASVSRFLDIGSLGNGGVTLVVDGMEVSALRVSASAVQQILINQDPYAAEYARPGRGRIEILTKPGSAVYHGEGNVTYRNALFDATNAFATEKPSERKYIVEGVFGGPMRSSKKTAFLVSGHDGQDDQQAIVYAAGPAGPLQANIPQANRQTLLSASLNVQASPRTTLSIRPSYEYESNENRGVGGTTLPSAGTNFEHREEQITYTQQTVIHPTLLAQFQLLVGHEREPTLSTSAERGLVVAGAFTGGGAQGDLLRTETHMQTTASLAWTKGQHLVQTGFQLPDWSRRGFDDHTNFGGTYYFANLNAYEAGRPYSLVHQLGNGNLAFLEKQVGAYIRDDWQVKPRMTVSLGLRYDWQNYFHDTNNLAPRVSLAYSPGAGKTNVIRAGAGVFNDRSGPVAIADILHSQPGGLVKYVISDPSYPDPFQGAGATAEPPSIVQLARDVQIPQTLQYSVGLDHQLTKTTTLSVTYTGAHGYHLFRSRDVNAPMPPLYLSRPDPAYGVVREIESNGRQQSDALSATIRGRMTKWFTGQAQYALSRAYNDTNGIGRFPANDYHLSGEYARADFDRRQQLVLVGRLTPHSIADAGISLTMNSAGPYTALLGQDIYNNGRGGARPPDVGRNTLEGAAFASLDLRLSRDMTIASRGSAARTLTFAVDAFNLTNRVNDATFVGTVSSPLFLQPVSARPPRQLQFSARVKF